MARTKIEVNEKVAKVAIASADKEGCASLQALWLRAVEIYNKQTNESLHFSTIMLRAKEWGLLETLETKPGKKGGRKGVEVDEQVMRDAISEADAKNCKNLNDLWNRAADIYNHKTDSNITFSVVLGRATAWNLIPTLKTKPGRKLKSSEPSQAIPESSTRTAENPEPAPVRRSSYRGICAPAGEPYAKLAGNDAKSVQRWVNAINAKLEELNKVFAPEAYHYWLNMYFYSPFDDAAAYQIARQNLAKIVGEPTITD